MLIDMSSVDMPNYIDALKSDTALRAFVRCDRAVAAHVHRLLDDHGLGFGYRLAKEVIGYHAFSARAGGDLDSVTHDRWTEDPRGSRGRP